MKAVTWHGRRDVRVDTVKDPTIEKPTDAIIEITSTNICGSDLHLYEVLGAFMNEGDILGHEPMGVVTEVGSEVSELSVGDRVVIPFQISCGHCYMCDQKLYTQCETTQVREQGTGAALFGYSELYGSVPGGQAEYLRVPQAQFTHIKVPDGPPDSRFVYLSDVLPTAWQAVEYADVPQGGSVTVLGLGPIGDMAARIAQHHGFRVIAVDRVDAVEVAVNIIEPVCDLLDIRRRDFHQPDADARHHASQAHTANAGGKKFGVFLPAATKRRTIRAQEAERDDRMTKRAAAVVVLPVHVICDSAAQRRERRSRCDFEKETVWNDVFKDFVERHAGIGFENAAAGIECMNFRGGPHRDQTTVIVMTAVTVGASIAESQEAIVLDRRISKALETRAFAGFSVKPAPAVEVVRHQWNAAIMTSAAPTAIVAWLRQSRMMKTTGSSCICDRPARIHIRSSM